MNTDSQWVGGPGGRERYVRLRRDTPAMCSCAACGNPRKFYGHRTLAEQSFDQATAVQCAWDERAAWARGGPLDLWYDYLADCERADVSGWWEGRTGYRPAPKRWMV